MVQAWKKAFLKGAADVFGENHQKRQKSNEALGARLYQQIGRLKADRDFLAERSGAMSLEQRRRMVDRRHPNLSTVRRCTLLGI